MAQLHKHGPWFYSRRQDRGLTQAALAKRVGIDRTYIAAIEAGKRWPAEETLYAILAALGVPAADAVNELHLVPNPEAERVLQVLELVDEFSLKLTAKQLAKLQAVLGSDSGRMLAQLAISQGSPASPDGWDRLGKEDRRLVQRLINRILDSYTGEAPQVDEADSGK